MQKRDKSGRFLKKKSAKKVKKSKPKKVHLKDESYLSLWEIEEMIASEVTIQLRELKDW